MSASKSIYKIIDLLAELAVYEELGFAEFVDKLIGLLGEVIETDSCLVYIIDDIENSAGLVGAKLKKPEETLSEVRIPVGEGITGWVAEHNELVAIEAEAYKDPRFKLFKQLPEDKFEAFLSVPIATKDGVVGVLNLQHRSRRTFTEAELEAVKAVAKIIASGFAKIAIDRQLAELKQSMADRKLIEQAKGILMREKGMSEQEAYKLIRTEAMRKRKPMRKIAEAAILLFD